jgi:hypothetical protein
MLPLMMMNGGASDMFGGLFNFDDEEEESAEAVAEEIDETEDDE